MTGELMIVRGGGDLATGVVQKLWRAGLRVLILETAQPLAIRRTVALCDAVYEGESRVEDMACRRVEDEDGMRRCWETGGIPLLVDPEGASIAALHPRAVVDAILAKRNLGTHRGMAPITVALGPGFAAGRDVDAVIETMRGHDLGRLLLEGSAHPNTGVPGEVGGQSALRVLHAPVSGVVRHVRRIGDVVEPDEVLFYVGEEPMRAPFRGLIRGLIRAGIEVPKGLKVADIDPRADTDWHTISDKARCLGGAVLEAVLYLANR